MIAGYGAGKTECSDHSLKKHTKKSSFFQISVVYLRDARKGTKTTTF